MTVEHLELLVEDISMEAALRILLPEVLGGLTFDIFPHQCKEELLLRLPQRFRGYSQRQKIDPWFRDRCRIVVVIDRDNSGCMELKSHLEKLAKDAGLMTRSEAKGNTYMVANRLAIEELEAWFFGDWEAVKAAYPRVSATISSQAKYREPDSISGGTWEAFERVLKKAGYFSGGLRKVEAALEVASHMRPSRNTSPSFQAFLKIMTEMARP